MMVVHHVVCVVHDGGPPCGTQSPSSTCSILQNTLHVPHVPHMYLALPHTCLTCTTRTTHAPHMYHIRTTPHRYSMYHTYTLHVPLIHARTHAHTRTYCRCHTTHAPHTHHTPVHLQVPHHACTTHAPYARPPAGTTHTHTRTYCRCHTHACTIHAPYARPPAGATPRTICPSFPLQVLLSCAPLVAITDMIRMDPNWTSSQVYLSAYISQEVLPRYSPNISLVQVGGQGPGVQGGVPASASRCCPGHQVGGSGFGAGARSNAHL